MRWFRGVAGPWQDLRVLDLGCAGGYMAEAIAREGGVVVGVDPAAAAIEAGRLHAAAQGLAIRYETGRAEAIPLPDHSVDRVVCVDVLEHVESLSQSCREIARVLVPGGVFLFDTVNRTRLSRWMMVELFEHLLRILPRGTHDPAKFIRPDELRATLEPLGFSDIRFAGLGPLGVNWRGGPVFGHWPSLSLLYLGVATRTTSSAGHPVHELGTLHATRSEIH